MVGESSGRSHRPAAWPAVAQPRRHVDPIGTLVLPFVGLLSGGFLLGWAKPVPVNVANLRGDWRRKFMLIAAAGPASNLVIAVLIAVLLQPVTLARRSRRVAWLCECCIPW